MEDEKGVMPVRMRSGVCLYVTQLVILFIVTVIVYLAGYRGMGEGATLVDYLNNEVLEYTFASSTFDALLLTSLRVFVFSLVARIMPFYLVTLLVIPSVGAYVVKAVVYEYASRFDYGIVTWFIVEAVLEVALFALIVRELPHWPESEQQRLLTGKAGAQTHLYYGQRRPLLQPGAYAINADDEGFDSADEYSEHTSVHSRASSYGSASEPVRRYQLVRYIKPTNYVCQLDMEPGDEELLDEMRRRFPQCTDSTLFRFLVGRNRDLDRATEMLRGHLAFRAQYDLDNMYFGYSPAAIRGYECVADCNGDNGDPKILSCNDCVAASIHKWTRDGQLIACFDIGYVDAKSIVQHNSFEFCLEYIAYVVEFGSKVLVDELTERNKRRIESVSAIVDLRDLGLRQLYMPGMAYLTRLMPIYEANYPEVLGNIFVINVPYIFQVFWRILKPIIPPRTLARIRFLGADYKEELLKHIAPEDLPARWGGLCNCRHPGGCVPPSRRPGYEYPDLDAENFWHRTCGASDVFDVPMAVTQFEMERQKQPMHKKDDRGVVLKWEYVTEAPLTVSLLYYSQFDVHYGRLLANIKVPAKASVPGTIGSGEHVVTEPGTYVLRFENTRSQDVKFRYRIHE